MEPRSHAAWSSAFQRREAQGSELRSDASNARLSAACVSHSDWSLSPEAFGDAEDSLRAAAELPSDWASLYVQLHRVFCSFRELASQESVAFALCLSCCSDCDLSRSASGLRESCYFGCNLSTSECAEVDSPSLCSRFYSAPSYFDFDQLSVSVPSPGRCAHWPVNDDQLLASCDSVSEGAPVERLQLAIHCSPHQDAPFADLDSSF
jgi:hypothetical protein